jgi:hypothetical protein
MDSVQKRNSCANIPLSQMFRSQLNVQVVSEVITYCYFPIYFSVFQIYISQELSSLNFLLRSHKNKRRPE